VVGGEQNLLPDAMQKWRCFESRVDRRLKRPRSATTVIGVKTIELRQGIAEENMPKRRDERERRARPTSLLVGKTAKKFGWRRGLIGQGPLQGGGLERKEIKKEGQRSDAAPNIQG